MSRFLLLTGLLLLPALARAQRCPTAGLAGSAAWYVNNDPVAFNGRAYTKYGLPRVLTATDVSRVGAYQGVHVYAEAAVTATPVEVLYLPVRAECEFQPYVIAPGEAAKPEGALVSAVTLQPGQEASGTLTDDDPRLDDDSAYDLYTFEGEAGQQVRITLRSEDFDAYLQVGRITGEEFEGIETDDDSAGGTDAGIVLQLLAGGTYAIRANALEADGRGRYTLSVEVVH